MSTSPTRSLQGLLRRQRDRLRQIRRALSGARRAETSEARARCAPATSSSNSRTMRRRWLATNRRNTPARGCCANRCRKSTSSSSRAMTGRSRAEIDNEESAMADMRLVVTGAAGRMGRMLIKTIARDAGRRLIARARAGGRARARAGRRAARRRPARRGRDLGRSARRRCSNADGVVDFSAPAATVEIAALAAQARIVHVVGTTGLSERRSRKRRRGGAPRADRALGQHEPRRQSARAAGARRGARARARSSTSRSSKCITA